MSRYILYKLCLGVMLVSLLSSCRLVEHYLYKEVSMPFYEGVLHIEVQANPSDLVVDGKRLTRYADPYSLGFRFETNQTGKLSKIRVSEISLEGRRSGVLISLLAREKIYKDYARSPYENPDIKGVYIGVGYEAETRNWTYEPYRLKARVRIYRDETTFDEKDIDVLLEPDFKKSRRSDTFDAIMSI